MNDQFPEGMQRALAALYSREPMTDADRAEHRRLVAAQAARDEAARAQSTQADLLQESR